MILFRVNFYRHKDFSILFLEHLNRIIKQRKTKEQVSLKTLCLDFSNHYKIDLELHDSKPEIFRLTSPKQFNRLAWREARDQLPSASSNLWVII